QTPATPRHSVAALANASAGHVADAPVQLSATSHAPATLRQTVAALANASTGHVLDEPLHVSATSQTSGVSVISKTLELFSPAAKTRPDASVATPYGPSRTFPVPSPAAPRIWLIAPSGAMRKTLSLFCPATNTLPAPSSARPWGPVKTLPMPSPAASMI